MIKKILNNISKHFPLLYDYYCKYIKIKLFHPNDNCKNIQNNLFHPIDNSICQLRIDFLKRLYFLPKRTSRIFTKN